MVYPPSGSHQKVPSTQQWHIASSAVPWQSLANLVCLTALSWTTKLPFKQGL